MSNLHIVVGISGVGKSTVTARAKEMTTESIEVHNYGDVMTTLAVEEDLIEDRDELTSLPGDDFRWMQEAAAEELVHRSEKSTADATLVDTHAALDTPFGYVPGLPRWSITSFDPESLINITASPSEIHTRRSARSDRNRPEHDEEALKQYLRVIENMATTCAVITGAYYAPIHNQSGQVDETARELLDVLSLSYD